MVIQALIPQSTIEALDIGILRGLARLDERQLHTPGMGPFIQCQAGKFRSMIDPDHPWQRPLPGNALQYTRHPLSRNGGIHLNDDTLPGTVIDHIQTANAPAVSQAVMHEIH